MPNQSHSGWNGVPWHNCDCHQKPYPVSQLTRQDGLIVCPTGFDNPQRSRGNDQRPSIISQKLADPNPEPGIAEILTRTDDTTDNY